MSETTFTAAQVAEVMKMLEAQKNNPASTTLTGGTLQGPFGGNANQYGLFSYPGARSERYSAQVQPRSIMRLLRPERSEYVNEIVEIQTGQTTTTVSNAAGWCGNPPVVGELKAVQQVHKFGSYSVKTNLNSIPNVGKLRDRADVPGQILNFADQENPYIPDAVTRIADPRDQLRFELYKIGNDFARTSETVLMNGTYTGATQNNYNGWWNEFNGLVGQIKTGYTDAATGVAAPAADSWVVNFNADITGTSGGLDFVEALSSAYRTVRQRAADVGMGDTAFAIVMRREMFYMATEVWACTYATYRCQTGRGAGDPVITDGMNVQNMRVQMLNGQYLLIDGVQVPVEFSDGLTLTQSGVSSGYNVFKADILILPIMWNGRQLIRLQYFPMDNEYATTMMRGMGTNPDDFITMNNGLWIMTKRFTGFCIEYLLGLQMRAWIETPFLAARLDNITFTYTMGTNVADPGLTYLYRDGGVTYR